MKRNRVYVIAPISVLLSDRGRRAAARSLQARSPRSSIRRNVANTHAILSFTIDQVPQDVIDNLRLYTQRQIKAIVRTAEWEG